MIPFRGVGILKNFRYRWTAGPFSALVRIYTMSGASHLIRIEFVGLANEKRSLHI